jgi:hypothetical protein
MMVTESEYGEPRFEVERGQIKPGSEQRWAAGGGGREWLCVFTRGHRALP